LVSRAWQAGLALTLLLAARSAHGQVDCDTPDDLCTGNPCVVGPIEVDDVCVLDFGVRTLRIDGPLKMPNSGELSLTANQIEVSGRIQNFSGTVVGAGPRITLTATFDINVTAPIRLAGVRGAAEPGELTFQAGGNLLLASALTAMTSPTTIQWTATNGNLNFNGRVNTSKPGGEITMAAGAHLQTTGTFRRVERIQMNAGGNVTLAGRLSARESLQAEADGQLFLQTVLRDYGSDVTLRGDLGVSLQKTISNTPLIIDDGSVVVESSAGPVDVLMPLKANDITITAAGDITLDALVAASPPTRSGGPIVIESTGGSIVVNEPITAQSGDGFSPGDGAGGHVDLVAAGTVEVRERILVNAFPQNEGAPGGTIEIQGTSVAVGPGVTFDADGDVPGPDFPGAVPAGFRVTATAGNASLDGTFHARGAPSVIQVTAAGDVAVAGDFRVAPSGCIGLDAGATLTTSGATFDTAPVTTCP
jgi:hypothetical protein